ncbi:MAG: LAGLIDADG family homing endonuclease, partial [Ignavibacteria bacterium]|nr:LAGLIDADG family homing endonuclease [Ignavibacteria bacterium]
EIARQENRSEGIIYKLLSRADYEPRAVCLPISEFWFTESPEKYYILGYLFADGNIEQGYKAVTLSAHIKDREIICTIFSLCGGRLYEYEKKINIAVGGKMLAEYLGNYGLTPRKSNTMQFPKNIPDIYIRDFIRGEFDGDGNISIRPDKKGGSKASFGFSSGSKEFLCDLRGFLAENGIDRGILREQKTEWGHVNQLSYGGIFRSLKMKNYLYYPGCLCLERKRDKFFSIKEPISIISKKGRTYYRHNS